MKASDLISSSKIMQELCEAGTAITNDYRAEYLKRMNNWFYDQKSPLLSQMPDPDLMAKMEAALTCGFEVVVWVDPTYTFNKGCFDD